MQTITGIWKTGELELIVIGECTQVPKNCKDILVDIKVNVKNFESPDQIGVLTQNLDQGVLMFHAPSEIEMPGIWIACTAVSADSCYLVRKVLWVSEVEGKPLFNQVLDWKIEHENHHLYRI